MKVISDFDDWQLQTQEVVSLDVEFGPIEVDACCDEIGSNAHFVEFWSSANDCRRHDWAGRTIYCNPPFSLMFSILLHFLKCKMSSPGRDISDFCVTSVAHTRFHESRLSPLLCSFPNPPRPLRLSEGWGQNVVSSEKSVRIVNARSAFQHYEYA